MTRWLTPADLSSPDEETSVMSREEVEALTRTAHPSNDEEITADVTEAVQEALTPEEHEHYAQPQRGLAAVGVAVGIGLLVSLLAGGAFHRCTTGPVQPADSGVRR